VANAIGAAIGQIRVHAAVEIVSVETGGYSLHGEGQPERVADATEALARAQALARESAQARAMSMGGVAAEAEVSVERLDIPGMSGDKGLISATVRAECVSRPGG
jgi:hypothetical protein